MLVRPHLVQVRGGVPEGREEGITGAVERSATGTVGQHWWGLGRGTCLLLVPLWGIK